MSRVLDVIATINAEVEDRRRDGDTGNVENLAEAAELLHAVLNAWTARRNALHTMSRLRRYRSMTSEMRRTFGEASKAYDAANEALDQLLGGRA